MNQKIGIIGGGNMGSAIWEGLFKKKLAKPSQVWVTDKIKAKSRALARRWRVHAASSSLELVKRSDIILLAVKPQDLMGVAGEFKKGLRPSQILISILAGTPLAKVRKAVGAKPKLVRAMPNLGAKVGEAITAITGSDSRALSTAQKIFSGCGITAKLPERHFDLVTAVSGSGPAYFFLLMELLERLAVKEGLSRKWAELLARQTALGAAKLAHASPHSHAELRIMVTSKKGTTEAALKVLQSKNFHGIFRQALLAALRRSRQISKSS